MSFNFLRFINFYFYKNTFSLNFNQLNTQKSLVEKLKFLALSVKKERNWRIQGL